MMISISMIIAPQELRKGIKEYMVMYNTYRPHDSLGGDVPMNVYCGESSVEVAASFAS